MTGISTSTGLAARLSGWLMGRFGLPELRAGQLDVITRLWRGRRVLFVAPTGHGKSLCYQALAASDRPGVVLVFQPLKALMREQVERARAMGLRAELINSDLDADAQQRVLDATGEGQVDVLFLAPERQGNVRWQDAVGGYEIKGVVIDEAHCISMWGHDFRPWYRRLVEIVASMGLRTPVLAVTATAPRDVVDDITAQIAPDGDPVGVVRLPSHRANLRLGLQTANGPSERLARLLAWTLARRDEVGMVYVLTTDEAEDTARFLDLSGVSAVSYHANQAEEVRADALRRWRAGRARVICATCALGMGVDRADVRWVVHLGLPDTLLRYVQEIGRVGRDGLPAYCLAIHDRGYRPIYRWIIQSALPNVDDVRALVRALRGHTSSMTRTRLVAETDIPEGDAQRILEDLCRRELVERSGGSPYQYSWNGGDADPVPPDIEAAALHRAEALRAVFRYGASIGCRAVHLAEVMQDDDLPDPCRHCDRCVGWMPLDWRPHVAAARQCLRTHLPEIKLGRQNQRPRTGRALSLWGVGVIGEEVRDAKRDGRAVAELVVDAAVACVSDPAGPYARVSFDAVVSIPPTTSGDFVPDFAARLAARLGLAYIQLQKTHVTRPQKDFRSRHHKRLNVSGVFELPSGVAPPAVAALLVDDVWGSGETLKAAARAIQPAFVMPLTMARRRGRS